MKKIFITTLMIVMGSIILFSPVSAANLKDATNYLNKTSDKAGTSGLRDIGVVTGSVINVALTLVGLIFLILMVFAGYLWMTARGEEEKVSQAQKIIMASIIGLVLVMSAYAISFLITDKFKGF